MAAARVLSPFSQIEYEQRAHDGYPVSCPTLDLSATWDSEGKNVLIYRSPNQVVSKIHQTSAPGEKAPEALAVTWKPDGQFLAIGWSDGFVRLMGLENNKAAHHIDVCGKSSAKITHIGWASTRVASSTPESNSELFKEFKLRDDSSSVDLPREITFLEIETAFPKISPLPSASAGAGEDAMVFTLRTGIEFLFQSPNPEDYDRINVMIVGTSDGKLQLSIHDSFIIGNFLCPISDTPKPLQLLGHTSHPQVPTHVLLLAEKHKDPEEIVLVPMDLPFILSSPINLSLLASKLTTLQKLLRYLKQTQLHMQVEYKNTRELPNRFIRSVAGDLEGMEDGPMDIISALYHTVMTGHAHEPVREWLVDSLAERGHKRWDKAVVSGLEALRSLVHENFLPALDRCNIILSRLRGLAQFHDARDDIGFSVTQIQRVMDIVSSLSLVGHAILVDVMDELEHFNVFSGWMRFQIDRLASTSANDELSEKEATMDNGKVITYLQRYLMGNPLSIFFDDTTEEDYAAGSKHVDESPKVLEMVDKQLNKPDASKAGFNALPRVDFLVRCVTDWSNRIFNDIAEAKKRSVHFGKPVKLSSGRPVKGMDMKMCGITKGKNTSVFTALTLKDVHNKVHIFKCGIEVINGISRNLPSSCCCIDLGARKLIDCKYLDSETLFLLCHETDNTPIVIKVPVQSELLPYGEYDPENLDSVAPISAKEFSLLSFPEGQLSRPLRMDVHERCDARGEMPARICLLEGNRTSSRTFALSSS